MLPDVNYIYSLDDSYCTEMQKAALLMYAIYPFQKYKFTLYFTWDIDCRRLFRNIWIIEDMVDLPIFSCTLQLASAIGLFFLFLCFASVPFHHASLLLFFLSAVDPDHFLDVHPLSEFVTLVLSSVYIYAFQLKVHEMHLWAISENWFVIGWSIFSSLVKVEIHLHNSWQIYKKSNRNV